MLFGSLINSSNCLSNYDLIFSSSLSKLSTTLTYTPINDSLNFLSSADSFSLDSNPNDNKFLLINLYWNLCISFLISALFSPNYFFYVPSNVFNIINVSSSFNSKHDKYSKPSLCEINPFFNYELISDSIVALSADVNKLFLIAVFSLSFKKESYKTLINDIPL